MIHDPLYFLKLARAYTAEHLPWFAPALFTARVHLTERVPVAAIDPHFNIYWNPAAVETMTAGRGTEAALKELGFVWVHEISHVLRDHADRANDIVANALIWNIAADFEINDSNWGQLALPRAFPALLPQEHGLPDGKLVEWYYQAIMKDDTLREHIAHSAADLHFDEGSGVHGQPRPWESPGRPSGSAGEEEPETSEWQTLDPISRQLVRMDTARAMRQHQLQMGNLPVGWNLWIDETLEGKVNWKQKLHHRLSIAIAQGTGARIDYAFSRPNRRQSIYLPAILPTLQGDLTARVTCVVDTSGSMSGPFISQALGEVFRVLQEFKAEVTVIPCDAEAYDPIVLRGPQDRFKVQDALKGGGGTDMTAGIRAAKALRPGPDTILVLTDGFTPYPTKPVDTPTVFGIILAKGSRKPSGPPSPPWPKTAVVYVEM